MSLLSDTKIDKILPEQKTTNTGGESIKYNSVHAGARPKIMKKKKFHSKKKEKKTTKKTK